MSDDEPKLYTSAQYWGNYQDGYNAGRRSVWMDVQDHGGMAISVILALYFICCGAYVFFQLLGWLLGV